MHTIIIEVFCSSTGILSGPDRFNTADIDGEKQEVDFVTEHLVNTSAGMYISAIKNMN